MIKTDDDNEEQTFSDQSTIRQVLGLALDFGLRLAGFPSPIGVLSQLPFSGTKPLLA